LGVKHVHIGEEKIPSNIPFIIVSNHLSSTDQCIISDVLSYQRHIHWVCKRELHSTRDQYEDQLEKGHNFVWAWLKALLISFTVKNTKTIPIDRTDTEEKSSINRRALRNMFSVLAQGGVLGLFPRGSRNSSEPIKITFIKLAKLCEVGILPIQITDTEVRVLDFYSAEYIKGLSKKELASVAEKIICQTESKQQGLTLQAGASLL